MNSILMKLSPAAEKLPVGSSKFLGNPDVWEGFEWPCIEDDGELYDLTFMCQINCAEAAKYDTDGVLPKTGMLYFFYDLDEMPVGMDDSDAARVIYYNGDTSKLCEMVLVDGDGEPMAFAEQKVEFECVEEGYLSDSIPTHLLLGVPSIGCGEESEDLEGMKMLLQIDSFETEDAMINFTDEGVLCFFADEDRIAKCDFTDVRILQIYS